MSKLVNQFDAAVSVLVGTGNIKKRLIDAYEKHLASIDEENLPKKIRNQFSELKNQMTVVDPLNTESRIHATVRKMSISQAEQFSREILMIYLSLMPKVRGAQSPRFSQPINVGSKPRIPEFLVKSANS